MVDAVGIVGRHESWKQQRGDEAPFIRDDTNALELRHARVAMNCLAGQMSYDTQRNAPMRHFPRAVSEFRA